MDGKSNRMNRIEKQKSKGRPYSNKHVRAKESLINKPKKDEKKKK